MTTQGTDSGATRRVSFYFSAHEDDWQLFMNPPAFQDVLDADTRCIFIHITAGDAGLGTGNGGRKHPFYLARENGAESAIRFMVDSDNQPPVEPVVASMTFNGHPIRRVRYRNTVAYFLRVPDGSPQGTGYAETGYQSLQRLAEGAIDAFTAIDDTTSYHGWSDLVATLRAVIDFERGATPSIQISIPELDPAINPGDHADHVMTAKAARAAAEGLPSLRWLHHAGYAGGALPDNLGPLERDMKCAVYAVTLAGVQALDHPTTWQEHDRGFVGRSYFRVEEIGAAQNT